MAARSGMSTLVGRFRSMVDDAGTAIFSDDRIQDILDNHRTDIYQHQLLPTKQEISGSAVYKVFVSTYGNLEGTATTDAFRLYDSTGQSITGYTPDFVRGTFLFAADQRGSARYIDARSYDLNGAVAAGWRERAAKTASGYDFKVEGRSYSRSQYFKHCSDMADYYAGLAQPTTIMIERGDCL